MATPPKRPTPKDNTLMNMIGGLVLSKSLILMEYNKNSEIINAKYIISKVSPEVYHFCKYCMYNPNEIKYDLESSTLRYQRPYFEFYIEHGDMGFKFNNNDNKIFFKIPNEWAEFSTSDYDKALLSSVYSCLNERKKNERILEQIQNTIDSKLRYLSMYKDST